jgi:hypothetical protein
LSNIDWQLAVTSEGQPFTLVEIFCQKVKFESEVILKVFNCPELREKRAKLVRFSIFGFQCLAKNMRR